MLKIKVNLDNKSYQTLLSDMKLFKITKSDGSINKNKFMNFAFIIGFLLQLIVIYVPGISNLFKFVPLSFSQFMICMGLSLIIVLIMEIVKLIERIKSKKIN